MKTLTNNLCQLMALLIVLFLFGCSAPLYRKAPQEQYTADSEDLTKAKYFARFFLSVGERNELMTSLQEQANHNSRLNGGTSSTMGLAGAAAMGENPFRHSGSHVASQISLGATAGVALLDTLSKCGGDSERISSIFLPESIIPNDVTSQDEAFAIAREYTVKKIIEAAEAEGRRAECILNCDIGSPTFRLIKKGMSGDEPYNHMAKDTAENEYYDPPSIYVTTILRNLEPSSQDKLRDDFLGFHPTWQSPYVNGWLILVAGDISRDESGNIIRTEIEGAGKVAGFFKYSNHKTPLASRLLRRISSGPVFMAFGSQKVLNKHFIMHGETYSPGLCTNPKNLIKGRIVSESLESP